MSGRNATEFSISPTSLSINPGGDSLSITLTCMATKLGERVATLYIPHNAAGSPATYTLSCTGTVPAYSYYPAVGAIIDFGEVGLKESSRKFLAVKNVGTDSLNISSIIISGTDAPDLSVSSTSFSLAPGVIIKVVNIDCKPTVVGTRTATLSVTHNAPYSPATYELTCGGVQSIGIGSESSAGWHELKASFSPDEILTASITGNSDATVYLADGIQRTGLAVPHSFDGISLLTTKSLPITLGGVSVTVTDSSGGRYDAGIFSVSQTEINWLMPSAVPDDPATVTYYNNGVSLMEDLVTITRTSPGMFTANMSGSGLPVAMVLRITINGEEILEPVSAPIDIGNKKDQVFLILCGTGFRHNSDPIVATKGGRPVRVFYSGSTADNPGLDQINLPIPQELRGPGNVVVNVSNPVTINIK